MLHNRRFAKGHVPGFQKTYLSREMTRAMAIDHPIGDPHGGPAFGERNDPVSAIISIGAMMGTYAAAGSFAAMTLMQGLAFAGAAISLVGNISGNKTLSKIGMIAGLAGGIGSLAESAGMFSSGTLGETFGIGADASSALNASNAGVSFDPSAPTAPNVSEAIVDGASFNPVSQELTANPFNGLEGAGAPQAPSLVNTPVDPAFSGQTSTGLSTLPGDSSAVTNSFSNAAPAGTPGTPGAPATPGAPTVETPGDPFTARTSTGLRTLPGDGQAVSGPGFMDSLKAGNFGDALKVGWTGIKDMGASWMAMAKTNPAMAMMMGNAITSVADVVSGKAGAQVDALEAQGQLSKAQADKLRFEMEEYKRKIAQQNSNYANVANPLASWKPPTPQGYTPTATPQTGLVANAMQTAG